MQTWRMPCDTTAASVVKQQTWSLLYDTTATVTVKQQAWPITYHTTASKATDVANDLQYKSTQSADRNEEKVFMAVKTCIMVFWVMMCCLVGGY